MSATAILTALACGRFGCPCARAVQVGHGTTHCPAHEDAGPSLSVTQDGKKILIRCHAGCGQDAVLTALRERGLWNGGKAGARRNPRRVVATYDYRDGDEFLYQVVRFEPKDFQQRRPDGNGGWIWNLGDVRRVLYRLNEVRTAVAANRPIWIVEGEKDADAGAAIGIDTTTSPMGAGKWSDEHAKELTGADVVIVADKDKPHPKTGLRPGIEHAKTVAISCLRTARSVRVLELPGDRVKDLHDWIGSGGTREGLEALADAATLVEPSFDGPREGHEVLKGAPERGKRPSQATLLVEIALPAELFHTPDDEAYARLSVNGHREVWPLRSRGFARWLRQRFHDEHGKAPTSQAVQDALGVIEGRALFASAEAPIFVRLAEADATIYLDLADLDWRAVEITAGGWRVVSDPVVRFRRPRGMLPLPEPVRGGRIDELREFVNVADDDWALVVGFQVATLRRRGPFPILNLSGEQGSGKSTTARVLRALVDPATAPLRAEPRDLRDLIIAATNGWLLAFDNLSALPVWLSDGICRLSTGGGFSTRELYSDSDEIIFDAQRPVVVNGIAELATRSDLLDRSLIVRAPRIDDDRRQAERAFWPAFEVARPRILGALLDAVVHALREPLTLARKPRMADFAEWVVSAEPALGLRGAGFLSAYAGNRGEAHELALEASPIAPAVIAIAKDGGFTGTASELLDRLSVEAGDELRRRRGWPGAPHHLSAALRRLGPNFRALGVDVVFGRESGRRWVRIATTEARERHERHEPHSDAQRAEAVTLDDVPGAARDAARPGASLGNGPTSGPGDADDASDAAAYSLSDDPMLRAALDCGFFRTEDAARSVEVPF